MSPPGCPKMWVKPCNRNAEESFPVLSLKSREQKPPNPLLIQDKNVLQPSLGLSHEGSQSLVKPSSYAGGHTSLQLHPTLIAHLSGYTRCGHGGTRYRNT